MKDIYFIAEIGINHNGSLEIAKELIDMAKECGCNAVKFQKRTIPIVYSEKILRLPSIWNSHSGLQIERKSNEMPMKKNNYITFEI